MKNVDCPAFACLSPIFYRSALLSILFMRLFAVPAGGQIYVAQTARGTGDGSSAANAHSLAWLNEASNWNNGAGTVQPGITVNLTGTFTNELDVLGSGITGKPITIYFEPNAQFVGPYWPQPWSGGGAITIEAQNYIVIDGGPNGLIEATNNGTSLQYQTSSCGVGAASSSYLTVKNLTIKGMYVRISNSDESKCSGVGVSDNCTVPPYAITNFAVTNCVISDAYVGIGTDYGPACRNYFIIGNTISRCNWGGNCGDRGPGATITNLVVADNHISDFTNWDDPAHDDYHHNGFYGWAESGGTLEGVRVYGNIIGPNYGGAYSTSGVFFSGNASNIIIYNNVFLCNPNDAPADGMITTLNSIVANNTFLGGGAGNAIAISARTLYNNLAVNCTFVLDDYANTGILTADYDYGYNLNRGEEYSYATGGSSSFDTFGQWQALGFDSHGSDGINPLLNNNGTLRAGSPMASAGTNLSFIFNTDAAGNPRPATGNWTVGAYQVSKQAISR
jgi:hypothetical protein